MSKLGVYPNHKEQKSEALRYITVCWKIMFSAEFKQTIGISALSYSFMKKIQHTLWLQKVENYFCDTFTQFEARLTPWLIKKSESYFFILENSIVRKQKKKHKRCIDLFQSTTTAEATTEIQNTYDFAEIFLFSSLRKQPAQLYLPTALNFDLFRVAIPTFDKLFFV